MKKDQNGFSLIEVLMVVAVIGLLAGIGWYVWTRQSKDDRAQDVTVAQNSNPQSIKSEYVPVPDGYRVLNAGNLTFYYPDSWINNNLSADQKAADVIADLVSPNQNKIYQDFQKNPKQTEGPSNTDLEVIRWKDVKDVIGEAEYEGMQPNYTNLKSMLTEQYSPNKLIKETTINGVKAYEVQLEGLGTCFGIMFEREDGIYGFNFININDKTMLTKEAKQIIDSIQFK